MSDFYINKTKTERENDSKSNKNYLLNRNRISLPKLITNSERRKILEDIAKTKSLQKSPIFITDNFHNNFTLRSNHRLSSKKIKDSSLYTHLNQPYSNQHLRSLSTNREKDFDIFGSEDQELHDLMEKFKRSDKGPRISGMQKRKLVFDQLYGVTREMTEKIKKMKKNKHLLNLRDYQNNVLETVGRNINDDNKLRDLLREFKELREDTDSIKPLPKINLDIIYSHVQSHNKEKSIKKMTIKELLQKAAAPKDEFEKEQLLIKNSKVYKSSPRKQKYKRLYNVPGHLRDILSDNIDLNK